MALTVNEIIAFYDEMHSHVLRDLSLTATATVDLMEGSGDYLGPYDDILRTRLEKWFVEGCNQARVNYAISWIFGYQPPALLPLTLSNNQFYVGDGFGTPIGTIQNKNPRSIIAVNPADARVVLLPDNQLVIGVASTDDTPFTITVVETLFGASNSPRSTVLTLQPQYNPNSSPLGYAVLYVKQFDSSYSQFLVKQNDGSYSRFVVKGA